MYKKRRSTSEKEEPYIEMDHYGEKDQSFLLSIKKKDIINLLNLKNS